jgi:deoxycytidylate deaminase
MVREFKFIGDVMIAEINTMFLEQLEFAERNQVCLRKAVGCSAITAQEVEGLMTPLLIYRVHNGPSVPGNKCTNEVGNCGCSHAEPRMVLEALDQNYAENMPLIMLCTYSPCTNCANIVIDSGLFKGIIYSILTEHDKRGAQFLKEAMHVMTVDELNTLTEKDACAKIKKWISN